jgi:CO/xanthine dehydrogenase Mo-binding subunit
MTRIEKLDRREFVKIGAMAGTGLLLGIRLPERAAHGRRATPFQPNAFVRVDPDGIVTIWLARSEMGQGVHTSLPMIVADELDADWNNVRVVQADAHPSRYGRMMTVGSTSVRGGAWTPLRAAGATARAMLVSAAAARWGVTASELRTERGRVLHDASHRSATYGELADDASRLPVPARAPLKDPRQFRLIGTRVPQVNLDEKVSGRARYGLDVRVPGMRFATVVHPPVFGGNVATMDATRALAVRGVRDVFTIPSGVAVVADSTWAAIKGSKALNVTWDNGAFSSSSADIAAEFSRLADGAGVVAEEHGDADTSLRSAAKRVSATYTAPYLAHATMEPMNCTARVTSDRCEVWVPTQNPQGVQEAAARISGLPLDSVTVHVTYLGCGWGRRGRVDYAEDALEIAKRVDAPVQTMWTREEDMQHDFYRPSAHVRLEGGVDAQGRATALRARIVAQPLTGARVDGPAVSGIADMTYDIPNVRVEWSKPDVAVPVGYWRSVGPSQNTFILESFVDEMAAAAGRDPLEFRRELLAGNPRVRNVLEIAAKQSGWGTALPAGRARGISVMSDRGGRVAEVAEVSLENGRVRVHRVTCVVDCGRVIHPGIVEAQMSGSIIGGLAAALYGEITLDRGRVKQANFNAYPMLRMREAPEIAVHIVPSEEEPGGVGEPGLPGIAPAVANALFTLTGVRVRRLPIRAELFTASRSG